MKRLFVSAIALAFLLPAVAQADDKAAIKHYQEATKLWNDPDPSKAVSAAEKALEQAESKKIKLNVLLLLGRLHQAKTGDLDAALGYYDKLIKASIGAKDATIKKLKSDAFMAKGNILYSEKDDLEGALQQYQSAHKTYATANNADTLSQLLFRLGRDTTKTKAAREKQLGHALKLSEEALERVKAAKKKIPALTAKYQLQHAIVLAGQGKLDESKAAWGKIKQGELEENSLYQQGLYHALHGAPAEEVAKCLEGSIAESLRPTVKTRNQLRKFIRTEPDFKSYLKAESWAGLVTDEGEGGAASQPTSRPSGN